MKSIPKKYLPPQLTKKDKKKYYKELKKSKQLYKKGKYYTRKKVSSFKSKPSKHVVNARKIYNIDKIKPSLELSQKTGCSVKALQDINKKGQGAYYSSGSRPNQSAHSWGIARLASAITGGKSAAVDYHILIEGCKKGSKALMYANKARKKHKYGKRKTPKVMVKNK